MVAAVKRMSDNTDHTPQLINALGNEALAETRFVDALERLMEFQARRDEETRRFQVEAEARATARAEAAAELARQQLEVILAEGTRAAERHAWQQADRVNRVNTTPGSINSGGDVWRRLDKFQVEKYKGSSNPVVLGSFLDQIEADLDETGITDDKTKLAFLRRHLGNEAGNWFLNNWKRPDWTWEVCKKELTARFLLPGWQSEVNNQLQTIKQTGSIEDYVTRFRKLLGMLPSEYQVDASCRDAFMRGLRREVKEMLFYQGGIPATTEEAQRQALIASGTKAAVSSGSFTLPDPDAMDVDRLAVRSNGGNYNSSTGTGFSRGYQNGGNAGNRRMNRTTGRGGRSGASRRDRPDIECFNCHEFGHFMRDCPKDRDRQ